MGQLGACLTLFPPAGAADGLTGMPAVSTTAWAEFEHAVTESGQPSAEIIEGAAVVAAEIAAFHIS
jgi:hypothetical protein